MSKNHARGDGRRRRRLIEKNRVVPKATQSAPLPLATGIIPPEEQVTEPSTIAPLPKVDEQTTDLTGRPGTPSTVRRKIAARSPQRSLLGPEAYKGAGAGLRPQTTDINLLLDEPDRATEHGIDPRRLFRSGAADAARMALDEWDDEVTPVTDARIKTDPFGIDLPADEVDLLARAGATMPEWDRVERSFFERETQPLDPESLPLPDRRPMGTGAALAVVAFGLVAVIALTISAWLALSNPQTATASAPPVPSVSATP